MNTIQKIGKNVGVIFFAQILTYLLGFITVIYTARYLGANGFGSISLALSLSAIFGVVVDMGLSTLMVREISRNRLLANKYVSNTAVMKIFLAFITFGLLAVAVNIIGYTPLVRDIIYIITLSVIINAFYGIFTSIFQASERMEYLSLANILNSVVLLAGTVTVIHYGFSIIYLAFVYVFTSSLVFIYALVIYLWKFSDFKFELDLSFWKPTIKEAWPFGIITISGMLYTYTDSILLSIFKGTQAVGYYSAAYRLMYLVLFIPTTINTAVFPVMSRLYADSSKESLNLLYERYFKYMIIIAIPVGLATTILAKRITLLIYGAGYTPSIESIQILIWAIVFTFAGAAYIQLLQSTNKQMIITKISIICLLMNIIINLILIPRYSFIGASIATFITEVILVGSVIFIVYRIGYGISYKIVLKDISKVLIASLIMLLFVWYFSSLNLIILVVSAAVIYLIVLYLVKGIDEVDISLVKKIRNF